MYGNILLIGGTGYLGAHIAYEFLTQNTGTLYFIVRNNDNIPVRYRLLQSLKFYFGDKFISKFNHRIKVVTGDVTTNINLGIPDEELADITRNTSTIINASGITSSNDKDLEKSNVSGVENIIKFCARYGKRFIHLSTTSISGNNEKSQKINTYSKNYNDKKTFAETNLYIGQELTNPYELSKFKAEFKILDAIYDGLDAQIVRLGNITNRFSDGVCSHNAKYNDFVKKIKSYIQIGTFPKYLLEDSLDFTPVDLAASAIIAILNHSSDCNVFHVSEANKIPISLISNTLNSIGIDITPVSDRLMLDIINGILGDSDRKDIVSEIIEDFDDNKKLVYDSNIELVSKFTHDYLRNCSFKWKKLDKNYIIRYINYFREIGFINF